MVDCPHCQADLGATPTGSVCAKCGKLLPPFPSAIQHPTVERLALAGAESPRAVPPSLADRYPLRKFDVTLNEMLGWSAEKVIATLGHPDSKGMGRTWPPLKPAGLPLVLMPSGDIVEAYVFGVKQQTIPFPTPYETWAYENVQGLTWVLHLV
jgi:hypothetical protein